MAYERSCRDHSVDLLQLATWLDLPQPPEGFWEQNIPEQKDILSQLRKELQLLDLSTTLPQVVELEFTLLPLIDTISQFIIADQQAG